MEMDFKFTDTSNGEIVMEYGDFIFIGENALSGEMKVDFLEYLDWLREDNFKILEEQLKNRLGLRSIPERGYDHIIQNIICSTDKQFVRKAGNQSFYECHAVAIMKIFKHIFSDDICKRLQDNSENQVIIYNYEQILKKLLMDIEDLFSLYSSRMKNGSKYTSNIRRRYIHTLSLHQVLRQQLYGNVSFHSFFDKEIAPTMGTIRELIELRIRRAIGVIAYEDPEGNFVPLNLSVIFTVLKKHPEVKLPIKLENIRRIYTWANVYVHSGRQDYTWIPYLLELILVRFSMGELRDSGWSADNGIVATKQAIQEIQEELLKKKNGNNQQVKSGKARFNLLTCKPECEI